MCIHFCTGDDQNIDEIQSVRRISVQSQSLSFYPEAILQRWSDAWSERKKKECQESLQKTKSILLLAKNKQEIVGYLLFSLLKSEVEELFVLPSHTSQGIGSQLLQDSIQKWKHSQQKGLLRLDSSLLAVPFYQKNGFALEGKTETSHHPLMIPMVYSLDGKNTCFSKNSNPKTISNPLEPFE